MIRITVERDRLARASREGARFRVRVFYGNRALLSSSCAVQSVSKAKREAEEIFGPLRWEDGEGDLRCSAIFNQDQPVSGVL